MFQGLKRKATYAFLAVFTFVSSGCGVILHPERQGQTGGRIDPAVAILDGIGLLFYVIPGLVAFAIDFHQGTIYLPGGSAGVDGEQDGLKTVKIEGEIDDQKIEQALKEHLGMVIDLEEQGAISTTVEPTVEARSLALSRVASSQILLSSRLAGMVH